MNNFDINIYSSYKVDYFCNYSYIDEYGDICTDGKIEKKNIYYNGDILLNNIIDKIKDVYFISFSFNNNIIFINHFNPNNGTGSDIKFIIKKLSLEEESKNEKKKD